VYGDAGMSGATLRADWAFKRFSQAAKLRPAPFDIVLTDDSSRIARDLADALRTHADAQILYSLRVIYISYRIDSASNQTHS
jgi:Resolvase, N terminal domain